MTDILSLVGSPTLASALVLLGAAVLCYIPGGANGAIVASHVFYGDDIRKYGSGNAGLTNFYRVYGARYVWCVILVDMGKAAVAAAIGAYIFGPEGTVFGKYFAGFFCIVGHMFPFFYRFKGGKGILCSAMTLILLDWRIALAGWGVFALLWATTKYVSLGSIGAALSFPVMTYIVYRERGDLAAILALSVLMAALVLWAHRENLRRLLSGTENKFAWHKGEPKKRTGEK